MGNGIVNLTFDFDALSFWVYSGRTSPASISRSPSSPSYAAREREQPAAKAVIARRAAALVQPGQVVILDAGTTMLQVAQHLRDDLEATVVTNSPAVALALSEHPGIELIMAGGRFHQPSQANIGVSAVRAFERVHADLCFLGLAGVHAEAGISILVHEEVFVKQAMIAGASRVVAVTTAEKLGTVAPYIVAPAASLTDLVTERSASAAGLEPLQAAGIQVIAA